VNIGGPSGPSTLRPSRPSRPSEPESDIQNDEVVTMKTIADGG